MAECADWAPVVKTTTVNEIDAIKVGIADRHWSVQTRARNSYSVNPETLQCRPGYIQQGIFCYDGNIPDGLERSDSHVGFLVQKAPPTPPGADNPVIDNGFLLGAGSFTTATYGRGAGDLPIKIRVKSRKAAQDPPVVRPFCKDVTDHVSDPNNLLLCRSDDGPTADEYIVDNEAGSFYVTKCKDMYQDMSDTCYRPKGVTDPITGQVYDQEDSYPKPPPREIQFDVY